MSIIQGTGKTFINYLLVHDNALEHECGMFLKGILLSSINQSKRSQALVYCVFVSRTRADLAEWYLLEQGPFDTDTPTQGTLTGSPARLVM